MTYGVCLNHTKWAFVFSANRGLGSIVKRICNIKICDENSRTE